MAERLTDGDRHGVKPDWRPPSGGADMAVTEGPEAGSPRKLRWSSRRRPVRPEFSQAATGQQIQIDSLATDIWLPVFRRRAHDAVIQL
jgi:hypothetical protein